MAKKGNSTKRFGARYGKKVKLKVAAVEKQRQQSKKCPYCAKRGVKRIAAGIWRCSKCMNKFTARAYSVGKKAVVKEVAE